MDLGFLPEVTSDSIAMVMEWRLIGSANWWVCIPTDTDIFRLGFYIAFMDICEIVEIT